MCKMSKKMKVIFASLVMSICLFFINGVKVEATYSGCNVNIKGTPYYDCGSTLYTYPEDKIHSSYIVSYDKSNIVYAGDRDGYSVFYINGFDYYNHTYDDRTSANNNIWTILKSQDKVLFDGSFNDSWVVDESHKGKVLNIKYADSYVFEQYYHNGQLLRKIVVYNTYEDKYHVKNIEYYKVKNLNVNYDGAILNSDVREEVLKVKDKVTVSATSNFGIKSLKVSLNESTPLIVEGILPQWDITNYIKKNLNKGQVNTLRVTFTNYLGNSETKTYKLFYLGDDVHISFETISSNVISSSRRIVVNALPGKGKTLDTDYCWYYWSSDPNDILTEDEFLRNYAKSEYKGSYSKDKGVILRNTNGTYYLYALAKDDDSSVVVRSEGYTLDKEFEIDYTLNDLIFVLGLLNLCVLPILIYVVIRKKGY